MTDTVEKYAQAADESSANDETRLHLVLGAGGVRCLSYVGAIRALEEYGYKFASVSACSGGTMIAALVCAGRRAEEIEDDVVKIDLKNLVVRRAWLYNRLYCPFLFYWPFARYKQSGIPQLFRQILGGDPQFKDLKIPFATTALDINSRELLVYSSETHPEMKVSEAIAIASAVPLMMPPYKREGRILVDSAVVSHCPVWLAQAHKGRDIPILALSSSEPANLTTPKKLSAYLGQLFQAGAESRDDSLIQQLAPHLRMRRIDLQTAVKFDQFDLTEVGKTGLMNEGYNIMKDALQFGLWPDKSSNRRPLQSSRRDAETLGASVPEDNEAAENYARIISSLAQKPIKILFLAANPSDTTRLQLEVEMRSIDEQLYQAKFRDRFDVRQYGAVRASDLQGLLLRHEPDIVHFSGHGSDESEIILEDDSGKAHIIPNDGLSQLFSELKDNIRCVVLNACYSEEQAQTIVGHIDCVVGMSTAITDRAAILFAAAFYRALGYGENVQSAFNLGRLEIRLNNSASSMLSRDDRNLNLGEEVIPKLLSKVDPSTIFFVKEEKM